MTSNIYLNPYKPESEGAKALAHAMGIKRIAPEGKSKFKGSPDKIVINWGASSVSDEVAKCDILNKPEAVALAADKLEFFKAITASNARATRSSQLVKIPGFYTDHEHARNLVNDGMVLVARTVLNGHSGRGIVVIESPSDFVEAPLYTSYIPKKQEYRVHVAGEQAVDVQRKARREDIPDDQVNWKIRNHDNGFVFARNESLGEVPNNVLTNSVAAVKAIGLDFGAVDIVFNDKRQMAYVLEINTAPGMSGQTLENYVARMTEFCNERKSKKTKIVTVNNDSIVERLGWYEEAWMATQPPTRDATSYSGPIGVNSIVFNRQQRFLSVNGRRVNTGIAVDLYQALVGQPNFSLSPGYFTQFAQE